MSLGATSTATALFSGVTNTAKLSIKSLGTAIASNPLGLLAVAITSIIALVGSMDSQIEKFDKTMDKLKETSKTLSEVKDNTKLVSQYEELDNKIKSNTLSTDELTKSRTDLLNMQKQLATLFPSLITG